MPKTSTTVDSCSSKTLQIPPAISYRLSDRYYIDNGWTSLPSSSSTLRVAIMKAKFSHPVISPWFQERNKDYEKYYPDGKILYVAKNNGTGKIFYPNGKLAINIEKGGVNNFRTRIWVYSHGEIDSEGKKHPAQLCGLFDSLGNGVVYGNRMEKRLVYNQKEGILWDSPIGVPVTWKWHDINLTESLSLINEEDEKEKLLFRPRTVFWDTSADTYTETEMKTSTQNPSLSNYSITSSTLSKSGLICRGATEYSCYLDTEKTLPRSVCPLKPIILRINKYLALRILSQSNISLSFSAKGHQTSLKIGVLYNPFNKLKVVEIKNSKEKVICPFEDFPPLTKSMLNFRVTVETKRKILEMN